MHDHRVPLFPGYRLGSYEIRRKLGEGGFGITYEAFDLIANCRVAIKEYFPKEFARYDPKVRVVPFGPEYKVQFDDGKKSFLKEARMIGAFDHPNIARVLYCFELNNTAYMVMRFEEGMSLNDMILSRGAMSPDRLEVLVRQLASALDYVHHHNHYHCDVAADNIMIRPDGTAVLIDFGAARQRFARGSGDFLGVIKSGYSPPEQYSRFGAAVGPWSDVYALGAVLYKCVSERTPPTAPQRENSDDYISAAKAAKRRYRPELLAAIDRALLLDLCSRPQSVREFVGYLIPRLPPPQPPAGRIPADGPGNGQDGSSGNGEGRRRFLDKRQKFAAAAVLGGFLLMAPSVFSALMPTTRSAGALNPKGGVGTVANQSETQQAQKKRDSQSIRVISAGSENSNPAKAAEPSIEGAINGVLDIAKPTEAQAATPQSSATNKSSSVLQVGAPLTEAEAKAVIEQSKRFAKGKLDRTASFVEPFDAGGKTRFRARFAGLSQAEAHRVCSLLKKQGQECWLPDPAKR